jgi:hypothetical protein
MCINLDHIPYHDTGNYFLDTHRLALASQYNELNYWYHKETAETLQHRIKCIDLVADIEATALTIADIDRHVRIHIHTRSHSQTRTHMCVCVCIYICKKVK